jgi:Fe-S cluster biogenesis protein NfuA
MRSALERALDEIRPHVQADGGDIELVDVRDGIVQVRLQGTCTGCPGIDMTLSMTVEPMLKERVPGIRSVVAV